MKLGIKEWLLVFVTVLGTTFASQASASHGRYGHITWQPRVDISPTTVDFRIVVAYRRSYFGSLQLGSTFRPDTFYFGDGTSGSYQFEVIALNTQEDWVIGQAFVPGGDPGVVRHTYPTATKSNGDPWVAYISSSARIGSLRNSANSNYRYATSIDLTKGNSSPISSVPPIVSCAVGACQFSIPVIDANNDPIRWSLTPLSESGIRRNPTGLVVDSQTGFVDWTQGSTVESLGLYALSVKIEDLDENGEPKSSVVVDFLINLQDFVSNQPPVFARPPSPEPNEHITAIVGQPLVVNVEANDNDLNDEVFLNNLGLPAGAQFETTAQGNPSSARLLWTPQMGDIGSHLVTFTATDQKASSALPLPIVIEVTQPAISDVHIIDRVSTNDIDVDLSSFSIAPVDYHIEDDKAVIEWQYPSFEVGRVENLIYDLQLKNLLPGETRLVIHDLELSYKDVNGNPITASLGSRSVTVAETVLTLTTSTDKIQYKPDEDVIIVSTLSNLDEIAADGSVALSIVDAANNLVANLGSFTESMNPSESRQLAGLNFNVGNTIVGDYRVVATLSNSAGRVVARAEAPFSVVTESGADVSIASQVHSDKPTYGAWDPVTLLARIQNTAGNAVIGGTVSEILVRSPNGDELLREARSLSSIAPNGVSDFNFYLTLNDAAPGTYQVSWITRDADSLEVLTESDASFVVERALKQSIMGNVAVDKAQIFHTGANTCHFRLENRSQNATGSVDYAYSLIHFTNEQTVHRDEFSLNLSGGEKNEWDLPIDANTLAYGEYGCVLEARINGQWTVVSSAGFSVLPPKITSNISLGNKGRLLVLTDEPRQCSALEDIQVEMDFASSLQGANKIEIKLYNQSGALLDTQLVSQFDVDLNSSYSSADADLSVNAAGSGMIRASINAANGHLGDRYKVKVSVTKNLFFTTTKEWSFDTTCDRPFTLGELYEDVRLLAYQPWLSGSDVRSADPFGPLDGPSVEEQEAYLVALLEAEGWEYTLVHTAEDFAHEHRTGSYSNYLVLSERPQLSLFVQKEVREAVFAGAGLVVAGAYDKRNMWMESALGVTVVGRHPWAVNVNMAQSDLGDAWSAPLPVNDWVLGAYLSGAQQVGSYDLLGDSLLSQWCWLDQGTFSLTDLFNFKRRAVTTYHYGKGKSVFASFDLLLQAAAPSAEAGYANVLKRALQFINPVFATLHQADAIPLQVQLNNLRGATTGQAILHLPEGASINVPGEFEYINDLWVWNFAIAEKGTLATRIYVTLPADAMEADVELALATDVDHQYLQQPTATFQTVVQPNPTMDATLQALDQLAWTYWYRLEYRDAYYKLGWAKSAMEAGDWQTAQTWLLTTANLLMFGDEADVKSVRWMVDAHIRQVANALNEQ